MAPTASLEQDTALPQISGYTIIEKIYDGSKTTVYRGWSEAQRPVVIKVLKEAYPSFDELVQFQNQYTIAMNLDLPGVVRPYSLEPWDNSYALIMEDFGGVSLQAYAQIQSLSLVEILTIALQLTEVLEELSEHRIVHKDIKPANVLIHPERKQIKLIDFSIASLLPKETQDIQSPNGLEGTLAYLAPEQTGRMNRGIDYRADFYSLGIMLYELLTGMLPFVSTDPLELVHCHMAKQPVPIQRVNEQVPDVLAAIVHKLMAKNAEERYQSAAGLKHDLARCLSEWKDTGAIIPFEIGTYDLCDRFLIPEKLYGRAAEVQALLTAFDRVAEGSTELMLVAGFSGIGKTAVVNEVHKPITRQQGYFVKGKFDQFNRNLPFSAFIQGLRSLIRQLLSENDAQLTQWQHKISEVLGKDGQVIVDVVPELEALIGPQPEALELSGNESQNRFYRLIEQFVQVFAAPSHPLVIFLDDLQWADLASLDLIKRLMQQADGHLLLLGAYRDNEVSAAHPLMLTVDELAKADRAISTITLPPLGEADINQLIADTLKCSTIAAAPLSKLIYQKAQGNPFFSTQLLKSLHTDGLFEFDRENRGWQCDITRVKSLLLSGDVVELMTLQLQKLPPQCQQLLKLAACVGNQFDLATLATVCEKPVFETANALWPALQAGFVLPQNETYKFFQVASASVKTAESDEDAIAYNLKNHAIADSAQSLSYKFLHDRIQQAAYALIAEDRRQATHLSIGQRLLATTSESEQEERLFEIVNHLNAGCALIASPEKIELAQLNLKAGLKAKSSTAHEAAIN